MAVLGEEMQSALQKNVVCTAKKYGLHCTGSKIFYFNPIHQPKPDPLILSRNLSIKMTILGVFLSNKTWNSWLFTLKVF